MTLQATNTMAIALRLVVVAISVFTIVRCQTFPAGTYGFGQPLLGRVSSPSNGHHNSFDNNYYGSSGSFHQSSNFGSTPDFHHSNDFGSHSNQYQSYSPFGERSIIGSQHHMDFSYNQPSYPVHQANRHVQTLTEAPRDFHGRQVFGGSSMPHYDNAFGGGIDGNRLESFIQNAVDRRVSSTLEGVFKRDGFGFGLGNGHISDGFASGVGSQLRTGSLGVRQRAMRGLPGAVMGFAHDNLKIPDSFSNILHYDEPRRGRVISSHSSRHSQNNYGFNDPNFESRRREIFG